MNARGIREWQLPGGNGGPREFPPPADRAVQSELGAWDTTSVVMLASDVMDASGVPYFRSGSRPLSW